QPPADSINQAEALHLLAGIYDERGDLDGAEELLQQALAIREETDDLEAIGKTVNYLGILSSKRGELDQAEAYYQRCLSIWTDLDHSKALAITLNNLGVLNYQKGALEHAENYYRRSYELFQQLNLLFEMTHISNNLGIVYFLRGELRRAEALYEEGLAVFEPLNDSTAVARLLNNLGIIYYLRGELLKAKDSYLRSLSLKKALGDPKAIAETRFNLSFTLVRLEELDAATAQVDQLAALAQSVEIPDVTVQYHLAKGLLQLEQGRYEGAMASIAQTQATMAQFPHFELVVTALVLLIRIHLQWYLDGGTGEHLVQADQLLGELEQVSQREKLHGQHVEAILTHGFLKRALFDLSGARDDFALAKSLAEEQGLQLLSQRAQHELEALQKQLEAFRRFQEESPVEYEQIQLGDLLAYLREAQLFLQQKL
ncbi:MAG: tetratricopeptide repeat protein, partial [Candidatus Thorarchaeota archaeon]